jgi:transposase
MSNQYTMKKYTDEEVNKVISLYKSGMSISKIGANLKKGKTNIKKILINNKIFVNGRDNIKIESSDFNINKIKKLFLDDGLSCTKISELYCVSRQLIVRLLKSNGVVINSNSNGKKIILTETQEEIIKKMYLDEYKNTTEIATELKLNKNFISKFLSNSGYRRSISKGVSIDLVKRYKGVYYDKYIDLLPEYDKYRREVLSITNKQLINNLDNYNKRGVAGKQGVYHLDHKFSINEGFKQGIKPEIIGNINNLEFIPWEDNLSKRCNCSITLNNLI